MDYWWLFIVCFFLLLICEGRKKKRKNAAIINHRLNHRDKEILKMKELAEKFIGKDCLVYTIASDSNSIKGVITEVTDSGLIIDYNGNLQAVNLEYVMRIQEWPKNAKGKKKNIFE